MNSIQSSSHSEILKTTFSRIHLNVFVVVVVVVVIF